MGPNREDGLRGDTTEIEVGELGIGVAEFLGMPQAFGRKILEALVGAEFILELDEFTKLCEEPGIDAGQLMNAFIGPAHLHGVSDVVQTPLAGDGKLAMQMIFLDRPGSVFGGPLAISEPFVVSVQPETESLDLHRTDRLLKRLLEGPTDRHALAHGFHLRGERLIGLGELLEGPARHLGDHVIDRWLEAGRRVAGDLVAQFIEGVAHRELGGDSRDGKTGRLGRQRARA